MPRSFLAVLLTLRRCLAGVTVGAPSLNTETEALRQRVLSGTKSPMVAGRRVLRSPAAPSPPSAAPPRAVLAPPPPPPPPRPPERGGARRPPGAAAGGRGGRAPPGPPAQR